MNAHACVLAVFLTVASLAGCATEDGDVLAEEFEIVRIYESPSCNRWVVTYMAPDPSREGYEMEVRTYVDDAPTLKEIQRINETGTKIRVIEEYRTGVCEGWYIRHARLANA